ncbi:UDP-N-acetylmuramate--L-alanine ligase [Candidatus Synechococcus calcipolaris G9]|uniref:UDP-N-acetylmuramate--L-alanine ligase n=1 Tax=Candidatus Synechococcus calcipolaris G9 TaxID=1497997 RepID=A0ABT6EW50_9SYNE|nr:UDP-N-acetylmuramate--L-alanine ligase [Candidatus Synechococcus calcipolaris]MDG2990010.1 UDP-N-acetylmuramate--L-alanine ligase [Candidatus Synechococcus calcipolaris G9]
MDFSGRPFHFIGIGGIGMSALAHILAKQQLPVSGSDLRSSNLTQQLQQLGVTVFLGQEAANLEAYPLGTREFDLPQVICSTAIRKDNPEYKAALDLGCPIFHRSDVLAALMKRSQSIAVSGTHGKTTTSSMIGYMLLHAGLDPTLIIGGEVSAWQGNARVGNSRYLVAEADESDGSLRKFGANLGIITNIELDHPDHYQSLDQVVDIFQQFANDSEIIIGCYDCQTVRDRIHHPRLLSYSLNRSTGADYSVDHIQYGCHGTTARVWERGISLGLLQLKVLGQHNLQNALAVIAVGRYLGIDFATIAAALATFEGARRRFEERGQANGIRCIDDYAHHPSEISATLASARLQLGRDSQWKRIIAVFQPHRYSRTFTFLEEFSRCFGDADTVILTDIYSAGEANSGLVTGQDLADRLSEHHDQVFYSHSFSQVETTLENMLRPGDLVLFLGAGNLNQIIPNVLAAQNCMGVSSRTEAIAL